MHNRVFHHHHAFHPSPSSSPSRTRSILRHLPLHLRVHYHHYHHCHDVRAVFEVDENSVERSFFSEIISSISDIEFTSDGRYIAARDYMTLKLWDVHNSKAPVKTVEIHDFLAPSLCDLYESDCIFDKFELASDATSTYVFIHLHLHLRLHHQIESLSPLSDEMSLSSPSPSCHHSSFPSLSLRDSAPPLYIPIVFVNIHLHPHRCSKFVSGSYDHNFAVYDWHSEELSLLQTPSRDVSPSSSLVMAEDAVAAVPEDSMAFTRKSLHSSWHPNQDVFAISCASDVCVFKAFTP